MTDLPAGPGVKFNPSVLAGDVVGLHPAGTATSRASTTRTASADPTGEIRTAAWSPDGSHVVFHKKVDVRAQAVGARRGAGNPRYELTLTDGGAVVQPGGDRFAFVGAGEDAKGPASPCRDAGQRHVRGHLPRSNAQHPRAAVVAGRRAHHLRHRHLRRVLQRLPRRLPEARQTGSKAAPRSPSSICDGTGFRELTSGPNNSGFPSMAPDGQRFVYRTFGPEGDGLRIMDIETEEGDAHRRRLRQLPAVVAARRSDHVLAPGWTATTRSTPSSRMAPA